MASEKRMIDINALLEEIERVYTEHYEKSEYKLIHDFFNAVRRRIRMATTVDAVEVVHGHWILKLDMVSSFLSGCEEMFSECSVCHSAEISGSNYCPNCGAKMDGDGNGSAQV